MNSIYVLLLFIILILVYKLLMFFPQVFKNYDVLPPLIVNKLKQLQNDTFNNKIYIFMSFAYPIFPAYGEYSIKIMQEYCKKHDYTFYAFDNSSDNSISPYWLKVRDMKKLLNKEVPEGSIVVYFDLDAIIRPEMFDTSLGSIINSLDTLYDKTWNMYVSLDPFYYEMNAGIIIARNTEWTRNFVDLWFLNYPKGFWKINEKTHKWTCNKCLWSGDEYEQGMFNRMYQRNLLDAQEHILPVKTHILGNDNIITKSFTLHLMANSDVERLDVLKQLYTNVSRVN